MNKDKMDWNRLVTREKINFDAKILGDSPYAVYEWHTADGVFYVGMGKWYRFQNVSDKSRSKEFMDVYQNNYCWPVVVACGMPEREARDLERNLIERRMMEGANLVNKQFVVDYYHTPANMKKYEFLKNRARERAANKKQYLKVPHSDLIVENGTTNISSVFEICGECDEFFSFLHACSELNCTVVFENEDITIRPGKLEMVDQLRLAAYTQIAQQPKLAEDYIRYLGNLALKRWK